MQYRFDSFTTKVDHKNLQALKWSQHAPDHETAAMAGLHVNSENV